jgi:hypothetical protein
VDVVVNSPSCNRDPQDLQRQAPAPKGACPLRVRTTWEEMSALPLICGLLVGLVLGVRLAPGLRRALAALRRLKDLEDQYAAQAQEYLKRARISNPSTRSE